MPVRNVPRTNQCAEIDKIAFGRGSKPAIARKPWLQTLSSMAFMGEPCPTNRTGIRPDGDAPVLSFVFCDMTEPF